jgi:hypothetical protein
MKNMRMKKYENKNGLKDQYNLAQGNALGWEEIREIVRVIAFIKERILFRTMEMSLCFPERKYCNSVRKELFALFIESSRTVFLLHPIPQALPGARISWPFRPEQDTSRSASG